MADLDRELDDLVRGFVTNLRAIFRKQMRSAFDGLISGNANQGVVARKAQSAGTPAVKAAPAAAKPPKMAAPAHKGGRRTDAEIEKTTARVKAYVAANPGSRMEHIGAGLGQSTKDLARPVAKLLTSGDIRREGHKRATKYFPGGATEAAVTKAPSQKAKVKGAQKSKKTSRKASATTAPAG